MGHAFLHRPLLSLSTSEAQLLGNMKIMSECFHSQTSVLSSECQVWLLLTWGRGWILSDFPIPLSSRLQELLPGPKAPALTLCSHVQAALCVSFFSI